MFQFFKIAFKQILSNPTKSNSKFVIYFGIISLALCLISLALAVCLSNGFKNEVNLKLSSIDGHYRINALNYYSKNNTLSSKSIAEIKNKLDDNSSFLSYSAYTEDYVLANISGKSEGLLIYGVHSEEMLNIFNISLSNENEPRDDVIDISIGKKLAENHNLKIGDIFFIFPIDIEKIGVFPNAVKVKVSDIFNSGFSEYDKAVCFIRLDSSRSLFDYGVYSTGIIGKVKNPIDINNNFSNIFNNIDQSKYRITTWIDRHQDISNWLAVYSDPIFFIIFLIIILAIFNMSLSLWILIQDRLKELSILSTLGFTKKNIASIIIFQNTILTLFSILIASLISSLLLFLQYKYKIIKISQEIYFVDYLPVVFSYMDVIKYYLFFFFVSIIISFIPALKLYSMNIIKHLNAND